MAPTLALVRSWPDKAGQWPEFNRGQKLNPNIFFSNFSGASGSPGISRQKKFDSLGFEGHTELFGPHPFPWKTPTPPENIRTQKFRFGFFFRA